MKPLPDFDLPAGNREVRLRRRPQGVPLRTDFELAERPLEPLPAGRLRIRNLYLSVDPVQRGWAADPAATAIGATMPSLAVGIVIESRCDDFREGDIVYGRFGWQIYCDAAPADVFSRRRDPTLPLSLYAGVLGMPGVTAYLALADLAATRPGDLVLVSTAAGAVGSVVGQLLRNAGARPIGIAGDDEKVRRCVSQFGYESAFNYKTALLADAFAAAAPEGFSLYFDSVGGPILDLAIRHMARFGRIIQCGTAATASWTPPPSGLRNEREILMRRLSWTGFVIFDHLARFDAAVTALEAMVAGGTLRHDEELLVGLAAAPGALEHLFAGANHGKLLIDITRADSAP
ncbi:MAG TPA: NADP-dependent oxidoreductase [Stellaceae bacterium]|nr:NADP-dependent oxidoreductase [Stellaceae bacterium]